MTLVRPRCYDSERMVVMDGAFSSIILFGFTLLRVAWTLDFSRHFLLAKDVSISFDTRVRSLARDWTVSSHCYFLLCLVHHYSVSSVFA